MFALASAAPGADLAVNDSVQAFLKFWEASKAAPAEERVRRFRESVCDANPEFYRFRFEDWKTGGLDPDEELLRQLSLFESYEKTFRAIHSPVRAQLDSSLASFSARFPDFKMNFPVWIVHSLGLADGTKRTIAGKEVFVIGMDMVARYHPEGNTAFFHHELLHLYHGQHYRQSGALFSHLWGEGLAVYVSAALNPSATPKELLLTNDRGGLAAQVDPILPRLAAELLADFQSQDWKVHSRYFGASSRDPWMPARAGYYIGYILLRSMADRYSLEQLIRLQDEIIAPALRSASMRIAQTAR